MSLSSRRNRNSSSAFSRATTTVSSPSRSCASVIAAPNLARSASTRRPTRSVPLQRALAPGVEQPDTEHKQERQHLDEAEHAELAKRHGPRIEKNHFDVEEDEQNRRHVEPYAESARRGGARRIAALE